MIVSDRLSAIIETISTKKLCDIGTDHSYIPIEAMNRGKIDFALACDVNKEPLTIGKNNIKEYGYENKIITRLSNGLVNVLENEATTCTICGMGGFLVIDILKENLKVTKSFQQLILQPQSDIDKVREYVLSIGFYIKEERVVLDSQKYYIILNCYKGDGEAYTEKDLVCGKNIFKDNMETYAKYIKFEMDKCSRVIEKLKEIEDAEDKRALFLKKQTWLEEVLSCIK